MIAPTQSPGSQPGEAHPYTPLMQRMNGRPNLRFEQGPALATKEPGSAPLDLAITAEQEKKSGVSPVETAKEFEALLVQQMVAGMRDTANVLGEGGLFGSGAGAETYTDWFDKELAGHVSGSSELGVVEAVMEDLARWKQVAPATKPNSNGSPA